LRWRLSRLGMVPLTGHVVECKCPQATAEVTPRVMRRAGQLSQMSQGVRAKNDRAWFDGALSRVCHIPVVAAS
jgi:hypothetical protein